MAYGLGKGHFTEVTLFENPQKMSHLNLPVDSRAWISGEKLSKSESDTTF